MACGSAARTLPWRRMPRSRSRTARLATPAVTAGSASGSASVGGAATYGTVRRGRPAVTGRSEEHTSELQSHVNLVCRLLLEKQNNKPFSSLHSNKKKKKNNK